MSNLQLDSWNPRSYQAEGVKLMISQAQLKAVVRYEPDTGEFYNVGNPNIPVGQLIGYPTSKGYIRIPIGNQERQLAHRLAWVYMTGEWPKYGIDHINRRKQDNRWVNLREATQSQNLQNQGFVKGYTYDSYRGKFRAQIKDGPFLGRFDTELDARAAYLAAKRQLHTFGAL